MVFGMFLICSFLRPSWSVLASAETGFCWNLGLWTYHTLPLPENPEKEVVTFLYFFSFIIPDVTVLQPP